MSFFLSPLSRLSPRSQSLPWFPFLTQIRVHSCHSWFPLFSACLRARRVSAAKFLYLLSLAFALCPPAAAAEPREVHRQTRNYRVAVDGVERGDMTATVVRHDDGTESMTGETHLRFNFIVYRYRFSSTGKEVWKENRLVELASHADFNGDEYVVTAAATDDAVQVTVNGESRKTPADVWVTSYWREPHASKVGRELQLFDAGKGRLLAGKLQRVGAAALEIAEKQLDATHYRLRGEVEVDLWYDKDGRLVRQESLESGHRTLLELSELPD